MFLMIENATTTQANIIRASAIVHAEPWGCGVKLIIEGLGEIRTETYDILGLAAELNIDDAMLEGFAEAA